MSGNGDPPRCDGCDSLERHRSLRAICAAIPPPMLSWRRALHFAPDTSFDAEAFGGYEESRYEGENSIDVRRIDRPDSSYDFLILSVVLEFVPEDRRAFDELVRIGSDSLIMQFTFGSTMTAPESIHFDEPHGPYGRFHDYGSDFTEWFDFERHRLSTVMVRGVDPVTGYPEPFYFFCRAQGDAETLRAAFLTSPHGSAVELTHPGGRDLEPSSI